MVQKDLVAQLDQQVLMVQQAQLVLDFQLVLVDLELHYLLCFQRVQAHQVVLQVLEVQCHQLVLDFL